MCSLKCKKTVLQITTLTLLIWEIWTRSLSLQKNKKKIVFNKILKKNSKHNKNQHIFFSTIFATLKIIGAIS